MPETDARLAKRSRAVKVDLEHPENSIATATTGANTWLNLRGLRIGLATRQFKPQNERR